MFKHEFIALEGYDKAKRKKTLTGVEKEQHAFSYYDNIPILYQENAKMKRTLYCPEHVDGLDVTSRENKTIVLPFEEETYEELLDDHVAYKAFLMEQMQRHPELFPPTMREGWSFRGFTRPSKKQDGLRLRRILTTTDQKVWQIRPSFVMPYMTCETETAEKILFLGQWAPDWALAHVFEHDVMMMYRLRTHMGRYNMVGTTVKTPTALPKHVGADEKHSRISGEKVYLATTVGKDCYLGASVSQGAGEEDLTTAYGQFQREAQQVAPDYQPDTVNTDGWKATMNAWKTLFPTICILQCFLHAILGIRNVATTATRPLYDRIVTKAWEVYQGKTKQSFSQRLRRFREWGTTLTASPLKTKLLKLCEKKAGFLPAYDFPQCLRTSNMIDRLMRGMDKYLFAKHSFHGTLVSAEYGIRAYCLLANFRPYTYNPVNGIPHHTQTRSPFSELNGFSYHTCWLHNMLIATSRQEIYTFTHKQLG